MKSLYEQGFSQVDVRSLFRFIDWLMQLPEDLERSFEADVARHEEEMQYITSIEWIGIEKGIQKGIEQGIERGRLGNAREDVKGVAKARFGDMPESFAQAVNRIEDLSVLKELLVKAVCVDSFGEFEQLLRLYLDGN